MLWEGKLITNDRAGKSSVSVRWMKNGDQMPWTSLLGLVNAAEHIRCSDGASEVSDHIEASLLQPQNWGPGVREVVQRAGMNTSHSGIPGFIPRPNCLPELLWKWPQALNWYSPWILLGMATDNNNTTEIAKIQEPQHTWETDLKLQLPSVGLCALREREGASRIPCKEKPAQSHHLLPFPMPRESAQLQGWMRSFFQSNSFTRQLWKSQRSCGWTFRCL